MKATYSSIRGPITSAWTLDHGKFKLNVSVPGNHCSATVYVPAPSADAVMEGGKRADRAKGIKFLRHEKGCAVFEVGSGQYAFESVR